MVILLVTVGIILTVGVLSFLVMFYNQLLLGYRLVQDFRRRILESFITLQQKVAVFGDDYQNYLTLESGRHIRESLGEFRNWLTLAVKELNQQWDYKIVEAVFSKFRSFVSAVGPDEKFRGDKNLEFIKKSEETISRMLLAYQKITSGYNERREKFPGKFIGNIKKLPPKLER